ncbi:HMG-Y-related protein A [Trifolium pratense]|uniref:HMG-Y-related protein A n=1 Tax=Trifolium pratense TaxID=57577 RepID=A0A2K3M6H3_TRIPR|nr:HMG-Y-related protein A [Trifolium pratense]
MKELNEECGSTEEAISEFIRREYGEDLPFAHTTILYAQLEKLCSNEDIVCKKGKYVLNFENDVTEMTSRRGGGDVEEET